jgi:hypothetical protein
MESINSFSGLTRMADFVADAIDELLAGLVATTLPAPKDDDGLMVFYARSALSKFIHGRRGAGS